MARAAAAAAAVASDLDLSWAGPAGCNVLVLLWRENDAVCTCVLFVVWAGALCSSGGESNGYRQRISFMKNTKLFQIAIHTKCDEVAQIYLSDRIKEADY